MEKRPPSRKPVTITDVARAAQVSKTTAARALGGYGLVRAAVKQRILDVAARLDYRANALARTMATGRSGTIGVIVGDIENPFFSLAVRGVGDRAKAAGFDVLLVNSAEDLAAERAAVSVLLSKGVDGLIVAPCHKREILHLEDAVARGRPLVLLDRNVQGLSVDVVEVDGRAAACAATSLLSAAGHRRLTYVTASRHPGSDDPTDVVLANVGQRIAGFLHAARAAGHEAHICFGAVPTAKAQAVLTDLLARADRPTAVLASDSRIALEVLRASRAQGLRIPDDISLISFDDADWTSVIDPAITVLAQPTYALGQAAADLLLDRIEDQALPPRHRVFEAVLIERQSIRKR